MSCFKEMKMQLMRSSSKCSIITCSNSHLENVFERMDRNFKFKKQENHQQGDKVVKLIREVREQIKAIGFI